MNKNDEQLAVGEVIGYTIGLNVLSARINVIVKVDDRVVKVPVDYRQKEFIRNEFPDGSTVMMQYLDGEWHIGSKPVTSEQLNPRKMYL